MQVTKTEATANVSEEAIQRYAELNTCISPQWRFIVMKLSNDESSIIVDHCEPVGASMVEVHEVMVKRLPDQIPVWIAYNFAYRIVGEGKRDKVTIIKWCPDSIKRDSLKESARIKMSAVACGGKIRSALQGAVCSIQGNTLDDLTYEAVLDKVSRFEREQIDHQASEVCK